jgi:hypothetical protein
MRLVLAVVLSLSLAATAFAQRGGGRGGGGFGRGGGAGFAHGGGFARGGGMSHMGSPGFRGGFARGGFFPGNAFRTPFRGSFAFHRGFPNRFGRFGFGLRGPRFVSFFGFPYYGFGGGYYDPYLSDYYSSMASYPYGYAAAPYAPSYEEPYVPPAVMNEPPPPAPPPSYYEPSRNNEPVSYLIAFNDHNIRLALAYWTENHNLRYVTMEHEIKTAPLNSVDRELSMRLNHERRITFTLPVSGG